MKRRQGFTLVELMVSMALIIFIMAILSQAFMAAMGTFRTLKAQGDMAEKLRSVSQILQRDLAADHFEGKKRLSDSDFWLNGPPSQGFFQVWQGTPPSLVPGSPCLIESQWGDPSRINSYISTNHALSFTVKSRGNDMGNFLSATAAGSGNTAIVSQLPSGIGAIQSFGPPESRYQPITSLPGITGYNYQWATVGWFLQAQMNPASNVQDTTVPDPTTGSTAVPLYTLYRRQAMLVPDNNLVALATTPTGGVPNTQPPGGAGTWSTNFFQEMNCWLNPLPPAAGYVYFNSPIDITDPLHRQWGGQAAYQAIPPGGALSGSDIQLNDVVSFDVRLLIKGISSGNDPFITLFTPVNPLMPPALGANQPLLMAYGTATTGQAYNSSYNFLTGPMVFDTWSSLRDGIANRDYSQWNVASTVATPNAAAIPLWNGTSGPTILAIQITIRIWDFKTNQTRQVTIVQAM